MTSEPALPLIARGQAVFVVEEVANPSADYFVLPACERAGALVRRCRFGDLPPSAELAGATVIFVRYLPAAWMRLVEQVRPRLASLVFFMDDDLLDHRAAAGMPWRYRWKLHRLSSRHAGWLRRQDAQLWVSTRWLADKYAAWSPKQLDPRPLEQQPDLRRVFYHGTASHEAEIRWLRDVMREVLDADSRIVFELVGGAAVRRLYRGMPRVNLVHPMPWGAYQAFMDMPGRAIGLAPLLDLPFNRARSCTKFFDITRCGAVGIYAEADMWRGVLTDGAEGLILPMEPDRWVRSILELAQDDALRERMLQNARQRLENFRR